MAESVTVYQYGDDFRLIYRMDKAIDELRKLSVLMEKQTQPKAYTPPAVVTRRVIHERQAPKRPSPALSFPFSVLALGIDSLLTQLDAVIARFVQRIIAKIIHRLQQFFRPKKQ